MSWNKMIAILQSPTSVRWWEMVPWGTRWGVCMCSPWRGSGSRWSRPPAPSCGTSERLRPLPELHHRMPQPERWRGVNKLILLSINFLPVTNGRRHWAGLTGDCSISGRTVEDPSLSLVRYWDSGAGTRQGFVRLILATRQSAAHAILWVYLEQKQVLWWICLCQSTIIIRLKPSN